MDRQTRIEDSQRGVTLIELILVIVIIGLAVPALLVPFSGLSESKRPEYVIQATFLAQKHFENIAGKTQNTVSCADITAFSPEMGYTLSCLLEDVANNDLNTDVGASSFAKKLTLTISRADGAMDPAEFYTLFAD